MPLSAVVVNCTLKRSPAQSNTEALAAVVAEALEEKGVVVEVHRALDHDIRPGVTSDEGVGDDSHRAGVAGVAVQHEHAGVVALVRARVVDDGVLLANAHVYGSSFAGSSHQSSGEGFHSGSG